MSVYFLPTNFDPVAAVKDDYVRGRIEVAELEADLAVVLAGGWPDRMMPAGLPPVRVPDTGQMETR